MTVVIITKNGLILRLNESELRIQQRAGLGTNAIALDEGDEIVAVVDSLTDDSTIMVATKKGMLIRFAISQVRILKRGCRGVRAISLTKGDSVTGAVVCSTHPYIEIGE